MLKRLKKAAVPALYMVFCLVLLATGARAEMPERPNRGQELYTPPWSEDVTTLAASCENLKEAECTLLRRLVTLPRAHWLGIHYSLDPEIMDLHNILRDAIREGKVPTIVLYSFPSRDCGGAAHLNKKMTADDYKKWVAKLATAILYYRMAINIIVEPSGLSQAISNPEALCDERQKSEVLAERIELIRYIAWNLTLYDKQKKRLNPNLRVFVDIGSPRSIANSKEMLAAADVLEKILTTAEFDGVSANIGESYTVDESLSWAKTLIGLVRLEVRKKLTVAIDIGHSIKIVGHGDSDATHVLGVRSPTLNYPDPRAELITIVSVPGDGRGPTDSFDFPVFLDYLRHGIATHAAGNRD